MVPGTEISIYRMQHSGSSLLEPERLPAAVLIAPSCLRSFAKERLRVPLDQSRFGKHDVVPREFVRISRSNKRLLCRRYLASR